MSKNTVRLRIIKEEVFQDYKEPCLFLGYAFCDWKCCKDMGVHKSFCQNSALAQAPIEEYTYDEIIDRFMNNPITRAIMLAGLEPFWKQEQETLGLIKAIRARLPHTVIIIYTGYYKEEMSEEVIKTITDVGRVIVKWGRYNKDLPSRYDETLEIQLASSNQYAEFFPAEGDKEK